MANLCWKLDLLRRGVASESLLDTYESERKPHATFWVEMAAKQAVAIQTLDPEFAKERDEFVRTHPEESAVPTPPALGPGLHEGDTDERAGKLSIQPILADGTRLDDTIGSHFLVAADRAVYDQLPEPTRAALDQDGDTVTLVDPLKIDALLQSVRARAVVIRPDRYILGIGDSPTDLERLVTSIPSIARLSVVPS